MASIEFVVAVGQVDDESQWKGMNDVGVNVSIIPQRLAIQLGMMIQSHTDSRMIGTAHSEKGLIIDDWSDVGG